MEPYHESQFKILNLLRESLLNFKEVVVACRRTVNRILRKLKAEGLIVKKRTDKFPFVCVYSLTDDGRRLLAQATPLEEVVRGLHRFGSAPLLQEKGGFIDGLVYVASPVKIFGRKPSGIMELRCCWQLVRPDRWKTRDVHVENGHECFIFDFPTAYSTFYQTLSERIKAKMAEKKVEWRRVVFHELRAYSFPLQERWRLSK